ncbi:ABC transporter ATP-binding protein [Gimesia panareensis]|uniref:Lipoprotein-releasing system ATP-binding protein LolD n=1 Tax=Gimesia panareensis TaxID=2527978 RepID=A0A517Q0B4_9PLAN|nr:ABC transporter ATP-binding protein [Gimesia panareensis]QDT25065.1 Lipoprotein-releasing system ATP-binding protein LolD [Gimesia panareensis]QDU48058.1 Lipoprotein-releasing system ATP-binding protein LolD [Gimesia panareensis]
MSLLLENVKKSYREPDGSTLPILDIERFELKEKEQVVLIGESGSGKSTLLNVISGITAADSGKVTIAGTEIVSMPEVVRDRFRAERIGFVFQTFNLLPAFSALENVLLGMSFSRKKASRERAKELLALVGLEHRLNHRPKQMSVGEQQRVAVARALANQPRLLLADEPTANVDVANQETILKLLRDACTQHQISMLMVTHSREVASQFERVETLTDFNKVHAQV